MLYDILDKYSVLSISFVRRLCVIDSLNRLTLTNAMDMCVFFSFSLYAYYYCCCLCINRRQKEKRMYNFRRHSTCCFVGRCDFVILSYFFFYIGSKFLNAIFPQYQTFQLSLLTSSRAF